MQVEDNRRLLREHPGNRVENSTGAIEKGTDA